MTLVREAIGECVVFDSRRLLPEAWRHLAAEGPVRTFNPGLLREGDGWVMAYRIVASDGLRRIALCRLDSDLQVIDGSQLALTDLVRFRSDVDYPALEATRWFADPRLYRLEGRVFIYWNSGWHEPRNWQFLQELDAATLRPVSHPRELVLRGERKKLEKNWTLFAGRDGRTYVVYSITPHRVLECSLAGDGEIVFDEVSNVEWSIEGYPAHHGGLRGGAPAVFFENEFWAFCHSVHDAPDGYRYAAAVYRFAAERPFVPTYRPITPLEIARTQAAHRTYPRLNPAVGEVIYPCGAARDGTRWLISHGINDEKCALSIVSDAAVAATLRRLDPADRNA